MCLCISICLSWFFFKYDKWQLEFASEYDYAQEDVAKYQVAFMVRAIEAWEFFCNFLQLKRYILDHSGCFYPIHQ